MNRRRWLVLAAVAVAPLMVPAAASAHGLVTRQDLPIPVWLFGWAAALVLVVSFVALASLWPQPRLQDEHWRPLPAPISVVLTSWPVQLLTGAIGVFLLGVVVWSGLKGADNSTENLAPTFVYITFWLGFVPLSVLFGDVFRAFNPWLAIGRAVAWVSSRAAGEPLPAPLKYPERLGRWPAVIGLLAFGWLEIASANGSRPESVAVATLVYSGLTFAGMGLYGVEAWSNRAEAFGSYFNLFSRVSIFERRGKELGVRRLLSGLPQLPQLPGTVALVIAVIGIVSFDGFSAGPAWNDVVTTMQDPIESLGFSPPRAIEMVFGLGLLLSVVLIYGFYRFGIWGVHNLGGGYSARELASTFAHTLVPIALAYTVGHYLSFLLLQGQGIAALASDPLGNGRDYFGTADWTIDLGWIGGETMWYLQVGAVVLGHVAGLTLAHDRTIALYTDAKQAVRSQYWMLAIMVGFTSLALWLLSESSKG